MGKIVVSIIMLSAAAFASAHEGGGTDIFQRTVNFIIFAAILYYLLAEPIKSFFTGRSKSIAGELERVQEKIKESQAAKEAAQQKVEEAKKFVDEIMETSKKESKILNDAIMKQCDADIENITKQNASLMEFEQRKMVRELVDEVLSDILSQESDNFDKDAMAQLIMKKVA